MGGVLSVYTRHGDDKAQAKGRGGSIRQGSVQGRD